MVILWSHVTHKQGSERGTEKLATDWDTWTVQEVKEHLNMNISFENFSANWRIRYWTHHKPFTYLSTILSMETIWTWTVVLLVSFVLQIGPTGTIVEAGPIQATCHFHRAVLPTILGFTVTVIARSPVRACAVNTWGVAFTFVNLCFTLGALIAIFALTFIASYDILAGPMDARFWVTLVHIDLTVLTSDSWYTNAFIPETQTAT